MAIDLYCVGFSDNTLSMSGSCGIVLVFSDEFGRTRERYLSYGLGVSDLSLCNFQAVRLALAAVAPSFRSMSTIINTLSEEVVRFLVDGKIAGGEDKVKIDIWRWLANYQDIKVVLHSDSESCKYFAKALELAESSSRSQCPHDSQTLEI